MPADLSSNQPGFTEFVVLIALIISLVALSIDAMLPGSAAGAYDATILLLVGGFAVLSIACLITMHWTEKIASQVLGSIPWRAK